MRRRIEITVYRRSTIVLYGQPEEGSKNYPSTDSKRPEPIAIDSAQVGDVDLAEAQLTRVDVARSPELTLLIEALVKNDGNSTRAARHLGLSRSDFISKLCGLGFATKQ